MIRSSFNSDQLQAIIVLQPNHSWTWRANLYLITSLMVVSCSVGLLLLVLGYWLIILFTLLEIALLAACLYCCATRTHQQEVLRLSSARLVLESGTRMPEERVNVQRFFARFLVYPAKHRGHRRSVALRVNDQEIEIGSFLAEAERDQLISLLRRTITRLDNQPASG